MLHLQRRHVKHEVLQSYSVRVTTFQGRFPGRVVRQEDQKHVATGFVVCAELDAVVGEDAFVHAGHCHRCEPAAPAPKNDKARAGRALSLLGVRRAS